MEDYTQTSTGAMADVNFSKELEKEQKKRRKEYEEYIRNALDGKNVSPPKEFEDGGSICGRPTGQGYRKARMR